LRCRVYKIKNRFFGEQVTVAGLVTGGDIIAGLAPQKADLGDELLVPSVMLRYERDLFLDGVSVPDIEKALGVKVKIVENNARDFIKKVLTDE
jgi:NifB/MoaA-like Fe-S oxidoreductase